MKTTKKKYDLRKMYEKVTGKPYDTKSYLKWLSGAKVAFIALLLFLYACAYSVRTPPQIERIDRIHVFHFNNQQWLRGITPFEPDTSRLIFQGTCVNWLGDSCNFPGYIMMDTIFRTRPPKRQLKTN